MRVFSQVCHGAPESGQIHYGRNTGEVLHEHTSGHKRDFPLCRGCGFVTCQVFYILFRDFCSVFTAQGLFDQDFDGYGKTWERKKPFFFKCGKPEIGYLFRSEFQRGKRFKRILHRGT